MILRTKEVTMEEQNLVKEFEEADRKPFSKEILLPAGIILVIILAGVGTGYLLSARGRQGSGVSVTKLTGGAEVVSGQKEVGIKDTTVFKDSASGKIEANGTDAHEGSHKLIRPGGASQTAYLTSSVVDLNQFLGKCVEVWGETFAAQKAGWLMDVGRVKILDQCPAGL